MLNAKKNIKHSRNAIIGATASRPAHRKCCPETLLSAITNWLEQLPPGQRTGRENDKGEEAIRNDDEQGVDLNVASDCIDVQFPPHSATSSSSSRYRPRIMNCASINGHVSSQDYIYRFAQLRRNGIFYELREVDIPREIASLWHRIRKARPLREAREEELHIEMRLVATYQRYGASASSIRSHFTNTVFPNIYGLTRIGLRALCRVDDVLFARNAVPDSGPLPQERVSTPRPSMAYGIDVAATPVVFSAPQLVASSKMTPGGGMVSASRGISFPFLVVEIEGIEGRARARARARAAHGMSPGGNPRRAAAAAAAGTLYAACNRSLGGSASCVKVIDGLNERLAAACPGARPVGNAAFGIVMDQLTAILQVTWSPPDGTEYHTKILESFALARFEEYAYLWKCVHNILRWGERTRLPDIQRALDLIYEQQRGVVGVSGKGNNSESPSSLESSDTTTSSSR